MTAEDRRNAAASALILAISTMCLFMWRLSPTWAVVSVITGLVLLRCVGILKDTDNPAPATAARLATAPGTNEMTLGEMRIIEELTGTPAVMAEMADPVKLVGAYALIQLRREHGPSTTMADLENLTVSEVNALAIKFCDTQTGGEQQ